jgi:hypothetical protein
MGEEAEDAGSLNLECGLRIEKAELRMQDTRCTMHDVRYRIVEFEMKNKRFRVSSSARCFVEVCNDR